MQNKKWIIIEEPAKISEVDPKCTFCCAGVDQPATKHAVHWGTVGTLSQVICLWGILIFLEQCGNH